MNRKKLVSKLHDLASELGFDDHEFYISTILILAAHAVKEGRERELESVIARWNVDVPLAGPSPVRMPMPSEN